MQSTSSSASPTQLVKINCNVATLQNVGQQPMLNCHSLEQQQKNMWVTLKRKTKDSINDVSLLSQKRHEGHPPLYCFEFCSFAQFLFAFNSKILVGSISQLTFISGVQVKKRFFWRREKLKIVRYSFFFFADFKIFNWSEFDPQLKYVHFICI